MDLITFSFFILFLPLFTFLFSCFSAKRPTSQALKAYPLIGHVPQFIKNRHRYLDWTTDIILSDPTRTMGFQNPFLAHGIITANPLNVEHIIKTKFVNYPKGPFATTLLNDLLGQSITSSDGEQWKHQRKAGSMEFSKKSLKDAVVDTVQWGIENRLLPLLRRAEVRDEILDLQDILECFGFDNICKLALNEDPACLSIKKEDEEKKIMSKKAKKAFGVAQRLTLVRANDWFPYTWQTMKLLDIGYEKTLRKSVAVVHDYAMKMILKRKELKLNSDFDILSHFESEKETNDGFLRDVLIGYALTGREMVSSALSWFFWLLSSAPEVEEKILKEVEEVKAKQGYEKLREMQYLHAALTESMRLYPPVAMNTVDCMEDDMLPDGTFVGKGWFVSYNTYAMGRLKELWGEDCDVFRPERWLKDGIFRPESPFKYPIFHAGPRTCLGKEVAYIQMKAVVARVLEEFKVETLVEKVRVPDHEFTLTLRMTDGLPVQVRRRE
ncbi:cytochrome P450 94A1-like [Dioscorea cayenensis subsp. rotundata]|uniref:Cytochrome P450 94A1-like n=1 Tax=Dioscorea cayennensis subsp. rotundata TaxID=55577 RepID=A0AB40BI39_DIOCR|nr:cytochrome P450 94A1-like [Dioscorea cayenensis subsp. rotundata]